MTAARQTEAIKPVSDCPDITDATLALLLSEGLDLCTRARGLDELVMRAIEAGMGRLFPGDTRCRTPALWVQELYDRDLEDWESRARSVLLRMGFAR